MKYPKTGKSKTTNKKAYKKSKKSVAKPSKSFIKKVKKVLHEQAESKQAYINLGDTLTNFNSTISGSNDALQIVPNISQGTADYQRIGDQIRAQKLLIQGHIKLYPPTQVVGTLANAPQIANVMARMFILSLKPAPSYDGILGYSGQLNGLLKKGGTTTGFTGKISDLYAPVNTDLFTVHYDKVFNLSQSYTFLPSTTGAGNEVSIAQDKSVKFFNKTIKLKNKILKYDSTWGGGLLPSNYGPFLCMGYSYLNGTSGDTVNTQLGMTFISTLQYEDV